MTSQEALRISGRVSIYVRQTRCSKCSSLDIWKPVNESTVDIQCMKCGHMRTNLNSHADNEPLVWSHSDGKPFIDF